MTEIEIMKFGGKSLKELPYFGRAAEYIAGRVKADKRVVVTVSAMGPETNLLIEDAKQVYGGTLPLCCFRERDKLLTIGEQKSSALLAIALMKLNIEAVSLSGLQIGLETDDNYGRAKIIRIENIHRVTELLNQGKVVIVTGFQGVIRGTDELVTLDIGGSDLTVLALTIALKRKRCIKFTNIDGVFAIDPQIVPEAKRFKKITYSQMSQLADAGTGVLMNRCVRLAQAYGIEIKVCLSPTLGKTTGGTLVCSGSTLENMETFVFPQSGVAIQKGICLVTISDVPNQYGAAAKIFGALSHINIIDCAQGQGGDKANISILCKTEYLHQILSTLKRVKEAKTIGEGVEVVGLTLVNPLMKDEPGWLYRVTNVIAKKKVNIEMLSSVGETIQVIVTKDSLESAARALAEEFDLLTNNK